jgi:hypothetical protein
MENTGDYNIVCNIPKDAEYAPEIRNLSEKEKTISFLMGMNALMSIKKSHIFDKDENTDALIKAHYEDIIKGKEIELNITRNIYNEEKEKIRKETREEYEMRYNDIMKKHENDKTKIHELEKALVLKEENIRHMKEVNKTMVELEIRDKVREKEEIINIEINEYKARINELEKQINNKNEMTNKMNDDILFVERDKIKREIKEYYEKQYQERNDEYSSLYKTYETTKDNLYNLEKELIKKEETIIHNKEINMNFIEIEVNKILKEKEVLYSNTIDEYKNKLNESEKEKYKIKEETKEYYDKQCQEKEKEINNLLSINETVKRNINTLEMELKNKEENLLYTTEMNKKIVEMEIQEMVREKEERINQLEKQIIINNSNNTTEENEKIIKLQNELNETKDKLTIIANEKNTKDIETLTKKMDEMEQNTKSAMRGNIGERTFYDLAFETFSSYEGFDITTNAKTTSHSGDHLLHFKNYTILTDTKNFQESSGVGATDINKLKRDMKENPQIKIAWLVSLYKPILKHAEHAYTIEIDQENGICYCYINSLMLNKNPKELLELVWYNCSLIYNFILNKESDLDLLGKYKRQEEKNRVILEKMLKQSKERRAILKQSEDNYLETEKFIMELMKGQLLDIRNNHAILIEEWWNRCFEKCEGEYNLKSKVLYERFSLNKDGSITEDMFKQIIKSLLGDDVITGKSEKTQYKILNWKWRAGREAP